MHKLHYITSNQGKIRVANKYLHPLGIEIVQKTLDLVEIQSDNIEEITKHKAEQAFAELKHPLLVNDAGWNFVALNGFPGAYMRYVNAWLDPDDFMNLMRDKTDKTVIFTEYFCYIDEKQSKLFTQEIRGRFLDKPDGDGPASWSLISLRDDGKSITKSWEEGIDPATNYAVWHEFAEWYMHK
jgi:non-canonical purine NTP pyrophosphatase (RdgB/HAM1 family)